LVLRYEYNFSKRKEKKKEEIMPIPSPKGEPKKDFLSKCMGDSVMVNEFPDEKQRYAVCKSKWSKAAISKKIPEWIDEDEYSDIIIY